MSTIYETSDNRGLVLFTHHHQILLCDKSGRYFGRPVSLANDYASQLTDVNFGGTIFFSYFNTSGHLIVRNITSDQILYQNNTQNVESSSHPTLIVFQDTLFLLYVAENAPDQSYFVNFTTPLQPREARSFPDVFSTIPTISAIASNQTMVVLLSEQDTTKTESQKLYRLHPDLAVTPLSASSEELESLRAENQRLLGIEEREQHYRAEMERFQAMVESASQQYNELMHVATRYRDEAIKWREKALR